MPYISVVTVCKEDRAGLLKTCTSFKRQGVTDSEQIIVVAPSEDNSHKLALDLKDDQIFVQVSPAQGIYPAMNEGWRNATGEWVLFLNAGDDFATETALEDAIHHLRECSSDTGTYLFGGVVTSPTWSKLEIPEVRPTPWNFAYGRLRVIHPSVVFRRQLIRELNGYNEEYEIAADFDLILRALRSRASISTSLLSIFYTGGTSTTQLRESKCEAKHIRIQNLNLNNFQRFFDSLWSVVRELRTRIALRIHKVQVAHKN